MHMIIVYWRQVLTDSAGNLSVNAQFAEFESNNLKGALACCEDLRNLRSAGASISHVCIQSELPTSVGLPGVADVDSSYSWYKRRIDPAIKLGRPS